MPNRLISPRLWTAFFSLEPRLSSLNTTSNVQLIPNFFISLSLVPFKCKTIITVCFLHNNPCGFFQGKVKYQKLPSGNSDYIEFYDKKGEMVTTYSNNDRTYTTNAEASRQTKMYLRISGDSTALYAGLQK